MRFRLSKIISFALLLLFCSCKKEKTVTLEPVSNLTPYSFIYPSYFPAMPVSSVNPVTNEGVALGRKLYYDPILSDNGYSCASCHKQSESFAIGGSVNSLAHVNLGWSNYFLWNGKISGSMEDIMKFEVEDFFHSDINKLNNSDEYKKEFRKVFRVDAITSKEVAFALAQFFKTLVSSNSKYDQFLQHKYWFTPEEMSGYTIFNTEKGDCFHCHTLGLLTDNKFHNIGLDSIFTGTNKGRNNITNDIFDIGLFKTPTLRNIALTAPYMHDGRYLTLEDVVEHYNSKVKRSSTLDPLMTKPTKLYGLNLSPVEKANLVAFLKTLTDSSFVLNPAFQKP